MTFNQMIREMGMIRQEDFLCPKVFDFNKLKLPKDSALIWNDGLPTVSNPILATFNKPVAYIVEELTKKAKGKPKSSNVGVNRILANRQSLDGEIKYVKNINGLLSIPTTVTIIVDYSELDTLHKYTADKELAYNRVYNAWHTIIDDTLESKYTNRLTFLHLTLPRSLPTFKSILKAMKYNNYKVLKSIHEDFFIHLEVIKYLYADQRSESMFSANNNFQLNNIWILLETSKGVTLIDLYTIFSMSKECEEEKKGFNKIEPKLLVKKYLKFLMGLAVADVDDTTVTVKANEILEEVEEDVVDTEVENYNITNAEIEEVVIEDTEDTEIRREMAPELVLDDVLTLYADRGLLNKKKKEELIELSNISMSKMKEASLTDEEKVYIDNKPNVHTVVDKSLVSTSIEDNKRNYATNIFPKHVTASIHSLSKSGFIVTDVEKVLENNASNRREKIDITFKQLNGNSVKLTTFLHVPDSDGVYKVNGSERKITKQRIDAPIKKTTPTEVVLSSYYGKLFIRRADNANNDLSRKVSKLLTKMSSDPESKIMMFVSGASRVFDQTLPLEYTTLSRSCRSFLYGGILFQFIHRDRGSLILTNDKTLKEIEKKGVLVGSSSTAHYVVDLDNNLWAMDRAGVYTDQGNFFKFIGLHGLPFEYIVTKVRGVVIPIAILLVYYKGMSALLKALEIKYEFKEKPNRDIDNFLSLRFRDGYLIMDRSNPYASLIVGSLFSWKNELKEIEYSLMNNRDTIKDLLSLKGIDVNVVYEFDSLLALFLDPMTVDVLESINEPTDFIGLLIRACELLKTDDIHDPRDMSTFVVKGDERLAGMLYHTLAKAISKHTGKLGRVRTKLTVDPYEVTRKLTTDPTFNLLEDLNPVEALKQDEEVTMLGMFGRGRETITKKDREFHPSMVGVMSEATKDNSNVGITTYLSANPNIKDVYGVAKKDKDLGVGNIYSTSAALASASLKDDGKRVLYISIQNKHFVATPHYIVLPFRTGEESVIPYRMGTKYCMHSKENGKVIDVTKKKVVIRYKDKKKTYKMKMWVGKDIAGKTYTHTQVTLLKKGDNIVDGDNIYYDELYFGEDLFNSKRVCYKSGLLALTVQTEAEDNFEDASNITESLAKKLSLDVTYTRDKIISGVQGIEEVMRVGDHVNYNDNLLVYRFNDNKGDETAGLSEDSMKVLESITSNKFKAEASGVIVNIEMYYNIPEELEEEMHPSMRELVREFDKLMIENKGMSGLVNNTFSVKGKGLQPGEIYFKYFIEHELGMSNGDKFRVGNQLKSTVANVFDRIDTESGQEAELEVGKRGIDARIVVSPYEQGMVNLILDKAEKDFLEELGL